MRAGVRALLKEGQAQTPPIPDYATLAADVREVCQVPGSDGDECLGLLLGALRAP